MAAMTCSIECKVMSVFGVPVRLGPLDVVPAPVGLDKADSSAREALLEEDFLTQSKDRQCRLLHQPLS